MPTLTLNSIKKIAEKDTPPDAFESGDCDRLIQASVDYLSSSEAIESIATDAYWPKWASPWWQMLTLHEIGMTMAIPKTSIDKIVQALSTSYLTFFPFKEEDVPSGYDPLMHIPCHCQLGTMDQLLTTYGVNLEERLPWLRPWYLKYQIGDGGLNCDEAAYLKDSPKSSVVSTMPPLEAVLHSRAVRATQEENLKSQDILQQEAEKNARLEASAFSRDEKEFLDNGAQYLIQKRLFRKSSGEPMDKEWLDLCFPRFYHYDVLRGLSFLLKWSRTFERPLTTNAIEETVEKIDSEFPDGRITVQRAAWTGANSRYFDAQSNSWTKAPAASFPLLETVSKVGSHSSHLSRIWHESKQNLLAIIDKGLLTNEKI